MTKEVLHITENLQRLRRLHSLDTLTYVNDNDVFEFMHSKMHHGKFVLFKNGGLTNNKLSISQIISIIEDNNLKLEQL